MIVLEEIEFLDAFRAAALAFLRNFFTSIPSTCLHSRFRTGLTSSCIGLYMLQTPERCLHRNGGKELLREEFLQPLEERDVRVDFAVRRNSCNTLRELAEEQLLAIALSAIDLLMHFRSGGPSRHHI